MVFKHKKRKSILDSKKYRMGRQIRFRNPIRIKKNLLKFKIFKVVNVILLIGIIGSFYFFIFSDFYKITNIEVIGNEIISTDDILEIVNQSLDKRHLLIFSNKNIFLFKRKFLKDRINEKILLEGIKIEKILPNTIRLTIKEKDAVVKWLTNNQEYLIDGNGVVIKKFYKESIPDIFRLTEQDEINLDFSNSSLPLIINLENQNPNLGDQVLNPEDIDFTLNLLDKLSAFDYLSIKGVSVPSSFPKYLEIAIVPEWKIYFNIVSSVDSQINRLDVLIKEKIKINNLSGLEYIDLRLGESVYYQ